VFLGRTSAQDRGPKLGELLCAGVVHLMKVRPTVLGRFAAHRLGLSAAGLRLVL
jgi:hypothetical protein